MFKLPKIVIKFIPGVSPIKMVKNDFFWKKKYFFHKQNTTKTSRLMCKSIKYKSTKSTIVQKYKKCKDVKNVKSIIKKNNSWKYRQSQDKS